MSRCEIWFEFDQAERHYHPGDTISGMIHVRVNKDCICNKIFLRMAWRTHGKGNRNKGGKQEFAFVENRSLTAGEDHAFPFRFSAPNGPLSYHGELINIDWYLTASVDIPWAKDPKAEEDFLLSLPSFSEQAMPEIDEQIETDGAADLRQLPPKKRWGPLLGVLFVMMLACFFIVPSFFGKSSGWAYVPFVVLPGLLIVGAAVVSIWFGKKAEEKVGERTIKVIRPHLRPGEIAACDVCFAPSKPEQIEGVSCVLRCREEAVSGSGTSKSTHRHVVFEQRQRLPGPFYSDPLEQVTASFAMRVPVDAPMSFSQPSNRLIWELVTSIEIHKWPNFSETTSMRVADNP